MRNKKGRVGYSIGKKKASESLKQFFVLADEE
jgi:hypothetical protein